MIKIEMLRVFRAVAEQGSLARAADVLGRTPSAVSMMLSQFEGHIGAPLFETDRKNRLTTLGALVLAESHRATDAFSRSLEAIERHRKSTAGTVRIATVPSVAVSILPDILTAFRQSHGAVRLEISDMDSAAVSQRVKFGEADIGIVSASLDAKTAGEQIAKDTLGIVCRTGGPIAQSGKAAWEALALEPFIANPLCALVDLPLVTEIREQCSLDVRNTSALLSFVRNGLGATILPQSALAAEAAGLTFIIPKGPAFARALLKIKSPDRILSPVGQAFCSLL